MRIAVVAVTMGRMNALVVYESMYGNTEQIARAIGNGLAERTTVEVIEVGIAPTALAPDVGIIVVGGPTHAFGMSRAGTREAAAKEAEVPAYEGAEAAPYDWQEEM